MEKAGGENDLEEEKRCQSPERERGGRRRGGRSAQRSHSNRARALRPCVRNTGRKPLSLWRAGRGQAGLSGAPRSALNETQ